MISDFPIIFHARSGFLLKAYLGANRVFGRVVYLASLLRR